MGPYAWTPETAGKPDVVASVFEAIAAVALLPLARRPDAAARPSFAAMRGRPATVVAIILTAYGSAGAGRYDPHTAHPPVVPITPAQLR